MRIRVLLLMGAWWIINESTRAQQLPQGTLYSLNPFVVNPALSGAYDFADVRLSYRRQWQGLDEAPNTAYLTAHTPVGFGNKVSGSARTPRYAGGTARVPAPPAGTWRWGAGAMVLADRTGPTERNIAQLTGAAHVSLPGEWQLSAGIGAGILQYTRRFDRIHTATPSDPILPDGRVSLLRPYFSVGLLVRKGNFWGGASVLPPRAISLAYTTPAGGEATSRLVPHYYLTAAYRLALAEDWAVFPQLWFKKAGPVPPSLDAQVRVRYADRVWGGVQYRFQDSMGVVLGWAFSSVLTLSYAYEYPLSSISSVATGSHEVLLGFRFNNRAAIYCPPMGW